MCMDQLVHALVLTYATTDVRVARPESLVDVVRYPEPTDIPRRLATVWVYAPHQGSKVSRPPLAAARGGRPGRPGRRDSRVARAAEASAERLFVALRLAARLRPSGPERWKPEKKNVMDLHTKLQLAQL